MPAYIIIFLYHTHTRIHTHAHTVTKSCQGSGALWIVGLQGVRRNNRQYGKLIYFKPIFPYFLKIFPQPQALTPKDLFSTSWSALQGVHYIMHLQTSCCSNDNHASLICVIDLKCSKWGDALGPIVCAFGPSSVLCSACNAGCRFRICSTADWPKSTNLTQCVVAASNDGRVRPAAYSSIFCGS